MRHVWVLAVLAVSGCGFYQVPAPTADVELEVPSAIAAPAARTAAGAPEAVPAEVPNDEPVALTADQLQLLEKRPYRKVVPSGYDAQTPVPLVLLLHGYSSSGVEQDHWFTMSQLAEARTFILVTPDGTKDITFQRFWNATDGCCNLYNADVDDVGYLTAVIDDVRSKYRIDRRRLFVIGHSNGSFMSHRLACDRADRVVAIVALAGNVWKDESRCQPSRPVSVLQVHGTSDPVVRYNGLALYPSAPQSIATWALKNRCDPVRLSSGPKLDLDSEHDGLDTTRERHHNCEGGAAELWTMDGAGHHPKFTEAWPGTIYDWLLAHERQKP
jgi:polyhydroxybutyrate depolymerase